MPVNANPQGVAAGKFTIPAGVPAGDKKVEFIGAGGSRGEAIFSGRGTLRNVVSRAVTAFTETRWNVNVDPLAQTFTLPADMQIGGVDLWFAAKGTSRVVVQIRETSNGFPGRVVKAEKRMAPADITLVGHTRVAFPAPVALRGGQEYAIVVMCDDADTALHIAELGKWDASSNRWVTAQPYQIGVMLSSSNASTWTAHQDRDFAFRLLRAKFTANTRSINLGNVAVAAATDLLMLGLSDAPNAATRVEYELSLPNGTVLNVAEGQPVRLPAAITGNVGIVAKLTGNADSSPVVYPGAQLVAGGATLTAEYITVAIPAGNPARVRVVYDATIPSGAAVAVAVSGIDGGDSYANVPQLGTKQLTAEKLEYTHEISNVNEASVRVKLTLTGTAASRPLVENLRVLVM